MVSKNKENIQGRAVNIQDKLQEIIIHMRKLDKYYPVDIDDYHDWIIVPEKLRENDSIYLKSVESNIPFVIDMCVILIKTILEFGELVTSGTLADHVAPSFETAQHWLFHVGTDESSLIPIKNVNHWVDDLIDLHENTEITEIEKLREEVRELLYRNEYTLRDRIFMFIIKKRNIIKKAERERRKKKREERKKEKKNPS